LIRLLTRLLALIVLLGAALAGFLYYSVRQTVEAHLQVAEAGVTLEVHHGESFSSVARTLKQKGIIEYPLLLRLYGRVTGRASAIQAGEYRLTPRMTVLALLHKMETGDVVRHSFTIVEGWTFRELRSELEAQPALDHTLAGVDDAAVMKRLGHDGENPEGRFLPETYQFPKGATDLSVLRRAYDAMQRTLDDAWDGRAEGLPLKRPYDALILASIIEKETGVPGERGRIAGVFVRRLRKGMRLQTDPTVIYGLGDDYDGNIHYRDLRRDTPYNTYTRSGLPPTPIAMPGAQAIQAAVHPATGDALYFVAKGDGTHHFSATLHEHDEAVRKYQLKRQ